MRKIAIPGFMLTLIALLFLAASAAPQTPAPASSPTQDTCVSCHQDTGGKMAAPIKLVSEDIHGQQGFSCDSCHGGDSSQADKNRSMDPRKDFVGKPSPRDVSKFCGKCHDNENAQYSASVHGKQVATGDVKPATCVSCHGAHGVYEVKDARSPVHPTHVSDTCGKCHSDAESMKPYGIPTDQAAKYRTSVHADALFKRNDLSAPTCNDCHGNHNIAPAKAGMAAGACATCHVRHAELFSKSPHKDGFEALGLPSCVTCHGNHAVLKPTDDAVGIDKGTTCRMCHDQGEPGYTAAEAIHRTLTSLDKNIVESGLLLDRAARVGMEVSGARFDLSGARDSLLNARVIMHTSSADEVGKTAAVGLALADKAHASGEAALKEHDYRRKGLGVALFVIGLAVISVYLKIRQIEAPSSNTEDQ